MRCRTKAASAKRAMTATLSIASLAVSSAILASNPAQAEEPIRIGVIAEVQSVAGSSIPSAAQLAADEINAQGGIGGRKVEIISYDNHNSAADSVRAFQRAVSQDHVNAVIASYVSEVVLALEPWAARLKTPLITPGAASDQIVKNVHDDYDHNKYTFHGYVTSTGQADEVCDGAKTVLVDGLKMKSAVVISEDAAWTIPLEAEYLKCLPKIGIKVLDHIRFSPDTTDFTPIFNKIEGEKPDVIITGMAHVGVQPVSQWRQQQVPIPLFGVNSQGSNSSFWRETNGAAEGVILHAIASSDVASTKKTVPFADAFKKRFGNFPSYAGYTAYDAVHYFSDAVRRAGTTESGKVVEALEATDWEGVIGRIQFRGRDELATHSLKIGSGYVTGVMSQWHDGAPVAVWPPEVARGKAVFPAFVKQNPVN